MVLRFVMTCLIATFVANFAHSESKITTREELAKKQKEQIDALEKNGMRQVVREYADSVVLIYSLSDKAKDDGMIYNTAIKKRLKPHHYRTAAVSGVLISQDGIICTTYSGIMNANDYIVSIDSELRPSVKDSKISLGKGEYRAKLLKSIPDLNLAFLKIELKDSKPVHSVKLGNDAPLINGKDRILINGAVVIGKARGEDFVDVRAPANKRNNFLMYASGLEKLSYQSENGKPVLTSENSITGMGLIAESEGGAILDMDGKLIGIANVKVDSFGNISQTAIPISVIKKGISTAAPGILKVANDITLGVTVEPVSQEKDIALIKRLLKLSQKTKNIGVRVKSVELKSISDSAGIQSGDIIIKFNNKLVNNVDTFKNMEKASSGDQTVSLKLIRKNNLIEIELYR